MSSLSKRILIAVTFLTVGKGTEEYIPTPSVSSSTLDAWIEIKGMLGGESWSICGDLENPCDCTFITCETYENEIKVSSVNFPEGLFQVNGSNLELDATKFNLFTEVHIGENNDWSLMENTCFNGENKKVCSWSSEAEFCCFEKLKRDFFDAFNGEDWRRCKGKRENLCDCKNAQVEVDCKAGAAVEIRLKDNQVIFNGTESGYFPAELINHLADYGLKTLNLNDNVIILNEGDDCPIIEACEREEITCRLPFERCTISPVAAPSTTPSDSPIIHPTLNPTLKPSNIPTESPISCEEVNNLNIGKKKRKQFCLDLGVCDFEQGECFDVTQVPSGSPTVPTEEPTLSPTVYVACEEFNQFGYNRRRRFCLETDYCEMRQRQCQNITRSPTTSPTMLEIVSPSESPVMIPLTCESINEFSQTIRGSECRSRLDVCYWDTEKKQCSYKTPYPSSAPTEISCEHFNHNLNGCESKIDSLGCRYFVNPERPNRGRCISYYRAGSEEVYCGEINGLYTQGQKKKTCQSESQCTFHRGECFDLKTCSDAQQFINIDTKFEKCFEVSEENCLFRFTDLVGYKEGVCVPL
eukprot:snap_masked-scaffold_52-processed-gene-1.44-mRNA-1 protein AED:1.00 eAED:1.00 QI:0/0/0/0/1/1/2/0/580